MKQKTRARQRAFSAAMVAVAMGASVLTASAGTASAAGTVTVAQDGGLVADGPLGRVFVGDAQNGTVQAADTSGALIGSVSGLSGVSGLAVSDDGATVYAACPGTHEIVAIDAQTLTVTARYPVTTDKGPQHLAFSAGKVWFTYGDQWEGNLGSVDPAKDPSDASAVALGLFPALNTNDGLWNPALISATPADPGVILLADPGMTRDAMAVVDVSGATPSLSDWDASSPLDSEIGSIGDIDLVPGASQVLVNGTDRFGYAGGSFTAAGTYPAGQSGDVAPNGMVAQIDGDTVKVYRPDAASALHTYAVPSGVSSVVWAPDASRIYALEGTSGSVYTLRVLADPQKASTSLTIKAPTSATRGKALTITGKLSAAIALPTGTRLTATRTDMDSPTGKALAAVTVGPDGTYSFTDTPPAGSTVTYAVSYPGDSTFSGSSASAKVSVSRTTPTLTINDGGKTYGYGTTVTFTAHLGSAYKNKTVQIWANPYGTDEPNAMLKSGTVNSSGNLSVPLRLTRNTTLSVVYAGDDRTAPRTVSANVYTRVWAHGHLTGQYRNAKIGSTEYAWYHKTGDPKLNSSMMYYQGRQERVDLQVYYDGSWQTTDSEYFALPSSGNMTIEFGSPGEAGIKARVRYAYVKNASGDDINASNYGSWNYMYFSN